MGRIASSCDQHDTRAVRAETRWLRDRRRQWAFIRQPRRSQRVREAVDQAAAGQRRQTHCRQFARQRGRWNTEGAEALREPSLSRAGPRQDRNGRVFVMPDRLRSGQKQQGRAGILDHDEPPRLGKRAISPSGQTFAGRYCADACGLCRW